MRIIRTAALAALLATPALATPALAQPQPPPSAISPETQALGATVMELTQQGVQLRAEIFRLRAENERLQAAKAAGGVNPPRIDGSGGNTQADPTPEAKP